MAGLRRLGLTQSIRSRHVQCHAGAGASTPVRVIASLSACCTVYSVTPGVWPLTAEPTWFIPIPTLPRP